VKIIPRHQTQYMVFTTTFGDSVGTTKNLAKDSERNLYTKIEIQSVFVDKRIIGFRRIEPCNELLRIDPIRDVTRGTSRSRQEICGRMICGTSGESRMVEERRQIKLLRSKLTIEVVSRSRKKTSGIGLIDWQVVELGNRRSHTTGETKTKKPVVKTRKRENEKRGQILTT
jgi:hypothetical protein